VKASEELTEILDSTVSTQCILNYQGSGGRG